MFVLPGWAYGYDRRAHWNRPMGNEKVNRKWQKEKPYETLAQVILGRQAKEITLQAKKLGRQHPEGNGRRFVADILLDTL